MGLYVRENVAERIMPHERPQKKGSFGGHLDDLVKQFERELVEPRKDDAGKRPKDDDDVHDRLFERAWRKADEQG
jgi:hypothetical protein